MHTSTTALRHARTAPRLSVLGLIDHVLAADARYRQRADLRALDGHLLRDIGITAADVDRELSRPFRW